MHAGFGGAKIITGLLGKNVVDVRQRQRGTHAEAA